MDQQEKIQQRSRHNAILSNYITLYILSHPELRYIQVLWASGIVDHEDRFYEEPYDTIVRVSPKMIEAVQLSEDADDATIQLIRNMIMRELKSMSLI